MKFGKLIQILLSVLILQSLSIAQYQSNFEQIDSLLGISASEISNELDLNKKYTLEFVGSSNYKILESKIIGHLQGNGIELSTEQNGNSKLNYNVDEARIEYGDVYRDGLFGTYNVRRSAQISGSYNIIKDGNFGDSKNFSFALTDSVLYSDISNLENIGYSFTTAEVPEEPFFSSTLEPVIAIGSAAVAIYLFFNIRSR